jgi:hypothetical protein
MGGIGVWAYGSMGEWENERMEEKEMNQFTLVIGNKNHSSWSLRVG